MLSYFFPFWNVTRHFLLQFVVGWTLNIGLWFCLCGWTWWFLSPNLSQRSLWSKPELKLRRTFFMKARKHLLLGGAIKLSFKTTRFWTAQLNFCNSKMWLLPPVEVNFRNVGIAVYTKTNFNMTKWTCMDSVVKGSACFELTNIMLVCLTGPRPEANPTDFHRAWIIINGMFLSFEAKFALWMW